MSTGSLPRLEDVLEADIDISYVTDTKVDVHAPKTCSGGKRPSSRTNKTKKSKSPKTPLR